MADTAFFDDSFNPSDAEKAFALKELGRAIRRALKRIQRRGKVGTERLNRFLKKHGEVIVHEFKTAEGFSFLLISTGVGLFVASLTYNIVVAVAVCQTIATLTAAAAGFITGLIGMGAGVVLSALAGISAIGIVPIGVGVAGAKFLAALGGIAGWFAGVMAALGLGAKMTVGAKIGAVAMAAVGLTATPAIAPVAAVGVGLVTAGAVLWGLKKFSKKNRDKDQ